MSNYKLVDKVSGTQIFVPSERKTFRGDVVTVNDFAPPRHEGSTGRVYCSSADGWVSAWYPSVIGAKIVEDDGND